MPDRKTSISENFNADASLDSLFFGTILYVLIPLNVVQYYLKGTYENYSVN